MHLEPIPGPESKTTAEVFSVNVRRELAGPGVSIHIGNILSNPPPAEAPVDSVAFLAPILTAVMVLAMEDALESGIPITWEIVDAAVSEEARYICTDMAEAAGVAPLSWESIQTLDIITADMLAGHRPEIAVEHLNDRLRSE